MIFAVMFLSLIGFIVFSKSKFHIPMAFCPVAAVSFEIIILYIGGLAGVLPYIPFILLISGCILFLYVLLFDRKIIFELIRPSFVMFCLMTLWLCLVSKGTVLAEYDNFSHWALAVKSMLSNGGLPRPGSLVVFYNYPPGTALFCYNAVKLIRYTDGVMLAAQGIMISSFLTVFFYGTEWKKPLRIIVSVLTVIAMTSVIWTNLTELYVDSLLGYSGAALMFVFCKKEKSKSDHIVMFLMAAVISQIKITGVLVVALAVVYRLISYRKQDKTEKRTLLLCLPVALVSIGSYFLYKLISYGDAAETTPFSVKVFGEGIKSFKFYQPFRSFFISLFDFYEGYILFFWSCVALSAVLTLLLVKKYPQSKEKLILMAKARSVIAVLWLLMLYFLYITMFNDFEMVNSSSFERYFGTFVILYAGTVFMLLCEATELLKGEKELPIRAVCALYTVPLIVITMFSYRPEEWKTYYHDMKIEARIMLMDACNKYADYISDDDKLYCVIDGYIEEILAAPYIKYQFMNENSHVLTLENMMKNDWIEEGNLLLYLRGHEDTDTYIRGTFDEFDYRSGLYRIENGRLKPVEILSSGE